MGLELARSPVSKTGFLSRIGRGRAEIFAFEILGSRLSRWG